MTYGYWNAIKLGAFVGGGHGGRKTTLCIKENEFFDKNWFFLVFKPF